LAVADQIKAILEDAEFNGQPIDDQLAQQLISEGSSLLNHGRTCASNPGSCGL
jgi:hypothetical protein